MTAPTRPVLRYHGGKWRLAPWIISHFPEHRCYVEPFGGGASVMLRKPVSEREVYNDLDEDVVNLFRVLRDAASSTRLKRSRYPAADWANYPTCLAVSIERFRNVVVDRRDALEVIERHDSHGTLFYVDPPYVLSTRGSVRGVRQKYEFELDEDYHRRLAHVLRSCLGTVVISGYPCELYDGELYAGWKRVTRAAMADGAVPRVEVLWLKPAGLQLTAPSSLVQSSFALSEVAS